MIPTYDDWREGLCEYLRAFDVAQQGYLRLQKLLLDRGHTISTHGLRGHHIGKYQDVGLTLGRLIEECIAADGDRRTLDWLERSPSPWEDDMASDCLFSPGDA